jgi:predicted membrane channel-forming protein YqfA (hemolysin III family)
MGPVLMRLQRRAFNLKRCDLFGISTLIIGSSVSFNYYAFYCENTWRTVYLISSVGLGIICVAFIFWDKFNDPKLVNLRGCKCDRNINRKHEF